MNKTPASTVIQMASTLAVVLEENNLDADETKLVQALLQRAIGAIETEQHRRRVDAEMRAAMGRGYGE